MTEPTETRGNTESSAQPGAPQVSVATDEANLTEAVQSCLSISQDVGLTDCAASEDTDLSLVQGDGLEDRQVVSPPAAESSSCDSKWEVGAECRTVWSEDGRLYLAKVVSVDGERCRVRFHGYGNEEDVDLSMLQSPEADQQTQQQNSQDWMSGSRCRAVYSVDGLVYPAVVLWVKGQRCRIRFDVYNNEEEQDVSSLLNPDELHGPIRATTTGTKGSSWRSGVSSNSDLRRRRRWEENQGGTGRGGGGGDRRSLHGEEQHNNSSEVKEKLSNQITPTNQNKAEEEEKTSGAEKPTNHSFCFFPPFPPPAQSSSGERVTFIPPPPPPLSGLDSTSNMLMLWYTCGFHTGSYMAQQEFKSSSKH